MNTKGEDLYNLDKQLRIIAKKDINSTNTLEKFCESHSIYGNPEELMQRFDTSSLLEGDIEIFKSLPPCEQLE